MGTAHAASSYANKHSLYDCQVSCQVSEEKNPLPLLQVTRAPECPMDDCSEMQMMIAAIAALSQPQAIPGPHDLGLDHHGRARRRALPHVNLYAGDHPSVVTKVQRLGGGDYLLSLRLLHRKGRRRRWEGSRGRRAGSKRYAILADT